jgi:hypothetical protein
MYSSCLHDFQMAWFLYIVQHSYFIECETLRGMANTCLGFETNSSCIFHKSTAAAAADSATAANNSAAVPAAAAIQNDL